MGEPGAAGRAQQQAREKDMGTKKQGDRGRGKGVAGCLADDTIVSLI